MKRRFIVILLGLVVLIVVIPIIFWHFSLANVKLDFPGEFNSPVGPYFGEEPPGLQPKLFAKKFISAKYDLHSSIIFAANLKEAYWSATIKIGPHIRSQIFFSRMIDERWTRPKPFLHAFRLNGDNPSLTPSGEQMLFSSHKPLNLLSWQTLTSLFGFLVDENIWYVEKQNHRWLKPKILPGGINSIELHWQFSLANDKTLYLAGKLGGIDNPDIYESKLENGGYTNPKALLPPINSPYLEYTPYIAPDKSYLIFRSNRPGKTGKGGLYISFRLMDKKWSPAIEMAAALNSPLYHATCPVVSPDGKYLFFLSHCGILWVDAKIIDRLKLNFPPG